MTKRNKKKDAEILHDLLDALEKFLKLKLEKWERVEGQVESTNLPGTPTEDWIIPPDEEITSDILMKDPVYRKLRQEIERLKPEAIEIAHFLKIPARSLDWLTFMNPLIGNDALEDSMDTLKLMITQQKGTLYFLQKIKTLC